MECTPLSTLPWLHALLLNPKVTDICINGTQSVFIDQGEGMERAQLQTGETIPFFQEEELKEWALTQLSQIGKTWDAKYPFIDGTLPSGHRIHLVFPPLARAGIVISLRRLPLPPAHSPMERPASLGWRWVESPLYRTLRTAILQKDSILISGATGSGKTTLANDLIEEIPQSERLISLEDTPELHPRHAHFITLLSRPPNADGFGEVTLRTLLHQCLRMRPDRIILGECRGPEVLELLQALNTGHRGFLATLHANSPRDALRRIELLCLLSTGGGISSSVIRELLSLGIQWIAQVKREGPRRKISELWHIEGREGDTILMRPVLH